MNSHTPATRYPDPQALTLELGRNIAARLGAAIAERGAASLIVSGGKSPIGLFEHLRTLGIDWGRVSIGLADERWVDVHDPSSNERLVRDHLLKDAAAAARFCGLKNDAATPALGALRAWENLARAPRPFDVVLLGMGDDGHTASLFPHSANLPAALDTAAAPGCIDMVSPTVPHARLSLNLAALLASRHIVILITGESKWRVYDAAGSGDDAAGMPVRAVLRQQHTPVEVVWSP